MARGNPDNLRAAAQRKHADAVQRAEHAINALIRDGGPVNFRAVARLADCSPDFLYRDATLRARIEQLRAQPRRVDAPTTSATSENSTSPVIRELAAQLIAEKRRRREDVSTLQAALAAAHGELLELRRHRATQRREPHP
jgi:hypothetical protein